MFDALQISATGMRAHEQQIDTISHNIANLNTVGFRRQLVSFAEISADATSSGDAIAGARSSDLANLVTHGAGTTASISLSSAAGELHQTGEKLDIAIDGAGFFEVTRSDGSTGYTRAGSLHINDSGELTTASGDVLSAQINIPTGASNIQVTSDGRVMAIVDGASSATQLGQIDLVTFSNPAALTPIGDNQYSATEQAGEIQTGAPGASGMGSLRQGYLESSNVQMVDELVALMIAQRAFEMNSRVAQAADQIQSITNGLIR